jgi:hypothetical protein
VCFAGGAVLPVVHGEDFPRQPLAGRAGTAPPCRPDKRLASVSVSSFLSTPLFSSLAMVFGHLAKASEPSSQTELCDAAV